MTTYLKFLKVSVISSFCLHPCFLVLPVLLTVYKIYLMFISGSNVSFIICSLLSKNKNDTHVFNYITNSGPCVTAIKCYECVGGLSGDCGDPFQASNNQTDCKQCAKAKIQINGVSGKKNSCFR